MAPAGSSSATVMETLGCPAPSAGGRSRSSTRRGYDQTSDLRLPVDGLPPCRSGSPAAGTQVPSGLLRTDPLQSSPPRSPRHRTTETLRASYFSAREGCNNPSPLRLPHHNNEKGCTFLSHGDPRHAYSRRCMWRITLRRWADRTFSQINYDLISFYPYSHFEKSSIEMYFQTVRSIDATQIENSPCIGTAGRTSAASGVTACTSMVHVIILPDNWSPCEVFYVGDMR